MAKPAVPLEHDPVAAAFDNAQPVDDDMLSDEEKAEFAEALANSAKPGASAGITSHELRARLRTHRGR